MSSSSSSSYSSPLKVQKLADGDGTNSSLWQRLTMFFTMSAPRLSPSMDFEMSKHQNIVEIVPKSQSSNRLPEAEWRTASRSSIKSTRRRKTTVPSASTVSRSFMFLFLLSSMLLVPFAQSATFFYGATEEAAAANGAKSPQKQMRQALAMAAAAADADEDGEPKLSRQELLDVYEYCQALPLFQQQGLVPDNHHTRKICKSLVEMLEPMFKRRNRGAAAIPSRARRHAHIIPAAVLLH